MRCEFHPYDCLIIDESESFLEDIFSGLCRGSNFEVGMDVFRLLMKTSKKIVFLDGFLKNSSLSVATNFAENISDIRLVIGNYSVDRGTLWELPAALKWTKKNSELPNNSLSIEGLIHMVIEHNGTEIEEELKQKLYRGSLFWQVKLALLQEGFNCCGPVNSVRKYSAWAANNLWSFNN